MLKLRRVFQNYKETGSLSEQINLFGFVDETVFLTKTGDLGVVLEVRGVDYECLDNSTRDGLVKRLESALKLFDANYRIYQYLFKRKEQVIPFKTYGNFVVDTAIRNRIAYFRSRDLYALETYFVVMLERHAASRSLENPVAPILELLTTKKQVVVLDRQMQRSKAALLQKIHGFLLQLNDVVSLRVLGKHQAFRFLKRTINFSAEKLQEARLRHDTFLDYYLAESELECHRGHLRVDDFFVKVLTLKEPPAQTFPLIFRKLLEIQADFFVVTEWKKEEPGKTRGVIQAKRRHFHNTKRSFFSQVNLNDAAPSDVLMDDSKQSQVRELGEGIEEIELFGNHFGQFSLSVVVYDLDLSRAERACAEFYKVFSVHDAEVYEERYNLLNAFLACVPGNHAWNLRRLYLLNTNYADLSFLFGIDPGERQNTHLRSEYLAVLESNFSTPFFLNLHYRDVAHTLVLGRTGSGKSFLLNFLITNLQKYAPFTFIFDLGGSFESISTLFSGSYVRVAAGEEFSINPFSIELTQENLHFLGLFVKVLLGDFAPDPATERDLYLQIENLYCLEPELRTLSVLVNMLSRELSQRLARWTRGGQFGFLFDNPVDTVSFAQFQCFDFQRMSTVPELIEPLLFYLLHRANAVIADTAISSRFKAFFLDEAWIFLRNPVIQRYVVEALKTWRKHNAAMVLSTQSLDELRRSDILDVINESCATKIFLANPDMDRELYQRQFHLNEPEIDWIQNLIPKQQFLVKTPEFARVANLRVDPASYWLYTNDPYDNRKRRDAFLEHGFAKGLQVLAGETR